MADVVHQGFRYSAAGEWNLVLRPTSGIGSAIKNQGWARDSAYMGYATFGGPSAGDYIYQGQRYTADGAAYVTTDAFASGDFIHKGIRRDSAGRMYITSGAGASSDFTHDGIRRTSDGAVYVAGTLLADYVQSLSPAAWFRFNTGVTAAQWDDQSGNGRHLKQATATNQPSVEADGSLLFDGVDNYMKCDAFTLAQPVTYYYLAKQITWTSGDSVSDGNTATSILIRQSTSSPQIAIFAGASTAAVGGWTLDTYAALAIVVNGSSSVIQVNSAATTGLAAGASGAAGYTLGARGDATLPGHLQVKEVVIVAAAHDEAIRRRVIRHLAAVGSLPA
jgi:hypothetical protein